MAAVVPVEQCTECGADVSADEMSLGCRRDLYACTECHERDCGCEESAAAPTN